MEASTREGKSRNFNVTVAGWRQNNGELWRVNQLVKITSESLTVNEELLIESVTYLLDSGGTQTRLMLVPKNAYDVLPELNVPKNESSDNQFIKG